MAPKFVAPNISLPSFSCPHCGALASQRWFRLGAIEFGDSQTPWILRSSELAQMKEDRDRKQVEQRIPPSIWELYERLATGEAFFRDLNDWGRHKLELNNIHVSECYSCKRLSLWKFDMLLFPREKFEVEANADLNEDIRRDFDEARAVLDISPRSTAALLRLCIQKLCKQLGYAGKDLNAEIGEMVRKGLAPQVQMALDTVRVVGNESVHPGSMDLRDDRETATKLFTLINRIAYDMITHPKELEGLYSSLPLTKLAGIAERDGQASE